MQAKEGEAAKLQHVIFGTNCKVLSDVVYGTSCDILVNLGVSFQILRFYVFFCCHDDIGTKFSPLLQITNFLQGTVGHTKWVLSSQLNSCHTQESGIGLLA
jgi:hypothetical protein